MGGIIQGLFGGKKSKEQSTATPLDVTPQVIAGLRGPVVSALESLIQTGGGAAPTGVAPLGGAEQDLLSRAISQAGGPSPLQAAGRGLLGQTISGNFLDPASNPFLAATIEAAQRPVIQAFQDVALPRLQGEFTAAGHRIQPQGSSAFDRAAAIATRGLTQQLGDISTNIAFGNYAQERQRQQEAAGAAEAISTQDLQTTITGLQTAALPRMIEQFGLDQGLEEFNRRITTILQALQVATGIPLVNIGTAQQGTLKSSESPGVFGTLLGTQGGGSLVQLSPLLI